MSFDPDVIESELMHVEARLANDYVSSRKSGKNKPALIIYVTNIQRISLL
jgi:hypothetical protein